MSEVTPHMLANEVVIKLILREIVAEIGRMKADDGAFQTFVISQLKGRIEHLEASNPGDPGVAEVAEIARGAIFEIFKAS